MNCRCPNPPYNLFWNFISGIIRGYGLDSAEHPNLWTVRFAAVTGLPAPRAGVLYVVSRTTGEAAVWDDVVDPDEPVLDDVDRIIGRRVLALVR